MGIAEEILGVGVSLVVAATTAAAAAQAAVAGAAAVTGRASEGPNIQTCPRESGRGVRCTSAGVEELFSVPSHPPALGGTLPHPSLKNETEASSVANLQ